MALENLMTHTVDIKRPTPVKGNSGGQTKTYTTVYTDQPVSIQPINTSWLVRYAQKHIDVTHSLYFNTALTVRAGDQIVYGTRTFLVEGKRDLIELGVVSVVDCRELL